MADESAQHEQIEEEEVERIAEAVMTLRRSGLFSIESIRERNPFEFKFTGSEEAIHPN